MNLLIAEDDAVSRRALEWTLVQWGFRVEAVADGVDAWERLQQPDPPAVVILDWMMPRLDGPALCRRVRESRSPCPPYLILLTARGESEDIVAGLENGADDYLVKPVDVAQLRARLHAGLRVAELQRALADRVAELEQALARVQQLQGLLPICSYCKRIRKDDNYWQQVEEYISSHSAARFTHGICPQCYANLLSELE